jgi:hypothetical protein
MTLPSEMMGGLHSSKVMMSGDGGYTFVDTSKPGSPRYRFLRLCACVAVFRVFMCVVLFKSVTFVMVSCKMGT